VTRPLSWLGILRLDLVQAGLGSVVVLATSTLNRVMVVELALPALIPGALVAFHYILQVLRPRLGYGSDLGGRRTPWIVGGMAVMALGGVGAAGATALMATHLAWGVAFAAAAFAAVGVGVGAAGTALLTLLAKRVDPRRRAAAATIVWLMMIAGIAVTGTVAGKLMDPFSTERLVAVVSVAAAGAFIVAALAIWGIEGPAGAAEPAIAQPGGFRTALVEIWAEPQARRFAIFVFVSMLAYSAQELILEPFAGAVFALTPGQSTGLTGLHHAGVLAGMALVAVCSALAGGFRVRAMRMSTIGGCVGSALAIVLLAASGLAGFPWPLREGVLLLGAANGAFAVSAIGSMMGLAHDGRASREGTRIGLWGAAQALAFGAGGLAGTGASDLARHVFGSPATAYAAVFGMEALLFLAAAGLAVGVFQTSDNRMARRPGMTAGVVQAG